MQRLKALVTAEVIKEKLEILSDRIEFVYDGYNLDHEVMPPDELVQKVKDIDILVCEYDMITADVLDAAQKLKIIICCRGGVKSVIDLEAAAARGITVCNNGGRNAEAVTDMTMGYILDLTRNISYTNSLIHNKVITSDESTKPKEYKDTVWGLDKNSPFIRFRGKSLNYMTLGIVGFGHAGRLIAKKASAFGMSIIACDPFIKDYKIDDVRIVSLKKLLKEADIVSVHCTLTDETANMFSHEQFAAMKDGAYFINTARGEIVDEDALLDALESGKLSGAAIDVTRVEPISSDSKLLNYDNLIITPHIAGSAYDVQATGTRMIVDSLEDWLGGNKPRNCVIEGNKR
ncbi:MAG: hydroxyacid dehydrogenase [Clostridia bacterium]|nr:hydroxyacid dehydrogenase [Clostridia bacterium]